MKSSITKLAVVVRLDATEISDIRYSVNFYEDNKEKKEFEPMPRDFIRVLSAIQNSYQNRSSRQARQKTTA